MHRFGYVPALLLGLSILLTGCGGGSENGSSLPIRGPAFGTNSNTEISGLYVDDISSCKGQSASQPNEIRVCVDDGPYNLKTGRQIGAGNRPFITVRLCVPGSTTNCVDVDHMLVDTGSTGVRVAVPALDRNLKLLPITTPTGTPVAECMHFISGWAWGSLNQADVYVGGLVARNVPIHMMGNSPVNPTLGGNGAGPFPTVPIACSQAFGPNEIEVGTIEQMNANGIIGLGVWSHDDLLNVPQFFVCSLNRCNSISNLPRSSHPSHLGIYFGSYPGGIGMSINPTDANGARNLEGVLTFGVPTLPINTHRLALNQYGYFTTTFNGVAYTYGFIDSGSIGFFFDSNTLQIPECNLVTGLYCPNSPMRLSAINTDINGNSNTITFNIGNIDALLNAGTMPTALNNIGGPYSPNQTDPLASSFLWGFPFFIGRTVYTVMSGTPLGGSYGLIAYTP